MNRTKLKPRVTKAYWSLVGIVSGWLLTVDVAYAAPDKTIFTRFSEIMQTIYGDVVGISTVIAVTAAAVALIVRMVSRNQRAVEEATNWLKNIIIAWLILNLIGFVVAYVQPMTEGGMYKG